MVMSILNLYMAAWECCYWRAGVVADRGMAHSEESRLANLLRRVSREDDRDRRLATLKQLKEFISHVESKVVSQIVWKWASCWLPLFVMSLHLNVTYSSTVNYVKRIYFYNVLLYKQTKIWTYWISALIWRWKCGLTTLHIHLPPPVCLHVYGWLFTKETQKVMYTDYPVDYYVEDYESFYLVDLIFSSQSNILYFLSHRPWSNSWTPSSALWMTFWMRGKRKLIESLDFFSAIWHCFRNVGKYWIPG